MIHPCLRPSAFGFLCLMAATTASCKPKEVGASEVRSSPIHVETVEARERSIPKVLALTGTLHGRQQTDLAANAAGRVVETFVERGAEVKAGQAIARLDVRAAALTASEARAMADLARTQASTAKRECERYQKLFDQGAISSAELDRVSDGCRTSSMSIAAAQARAQVTAQIVGDGVIRAPFVGVVTERWVDVGEYVRQDSKVASIVAIDTLKLELTVPEASFAAVKQGGALTFTVPTYPGRTFSGVVRYIGASVREATRDLVVEAFVENGDRALRPGMFASIALVTGEAPAPVIPRSALVEKDGRDHAYVVVGQRIEERVVQVSAQLGDDVAVLRGITVGEHVVAKPAADLRNGQAVN